MDVRSTARRAWTRRGARWAAIAGALVTALAPAAADAATYRVYACKGPSGQPLGMQRPLGWALTADSGAVVQDSCATASPPDGLGNRAHVTMHGGIPGGGSGGWILAEPAGAQLTHVSADVAAAQGAGNNGLSIASRLHVAQGDLWRRTGVFSRESVSFAVPGASAWAHLGLVCENGGSGCAAVGHRLEVFGTVATLSDTDAPSVTAVSGSLLQAGYKRGRIAASATLLDEGSGVRTSTLGVYTTSVGVTHVVPDNDGRCTPLDGDARGFTTTTPCTTLSSDSHELDVSGLADGAYHVGYLAEDAAGNTVTVADRQIRVNNPGGSVPDTACTDGLDNDGDGRYDFHDDAGCVAESDGAETQDPVGTAAPAVGGTAAVGSTLTAASGAWDDGPGTGGTTTRRWQAARHDGAAPVDIDGATGPTLKLTDAEVGRRIRVVETRTTSQGVAVRASDLTAPVTAADGTLPDCADGRDNDDDNAVDRDADEGCASRSDTTEHLLGGHDDLDGDGVPNREDADDDGDGTPDGTDVAPQDPQVGGSGDDFDGDGIRNADDPDDDNDGLRDAEDPYPFNPLLPAGSKTPPGDFDGDGVPNRDDADDDNDGTPDASDPAPFDRATDKGSTAPPSGSAPAGAAAAAVAPNGAGASSRATVSLVGQQSRSLRHGQRTVMAGRVVDEHGAGIAGAVIAVEEQPMVPGHGPVRGASFTPVAVAKPVVTDKDGRFRHLLAAGPSRVVRFGYKARTADRDFSSVQELTLVVRSKATLKVDRRAVRNGRSVRFSGRLLGGMVPRTGVEVVLQARTPRGWVTFDTARASRTGRFSTSYRFRATTRTQVYAFRARVRPDSAYPWTASTTKTVKVKVTP